MENGDVLEGFSEEINMVVEKKSFKKSGVFPTDFSQQIVQALGNSDKKGGKFNENHNFSWASRKYVLFAGYISGSNTEMPTAHWYFGSKSPLVISSGKVFFAKVEKSLVYMPFCRVIFLLKLAVYLSLLNLQT